MGIGTAIYAAYYTSNRLNIGVAGENLYSCRYISIFILIEYQSRAGRIDTDDRVIIGTS